MDQPQRFAKPNGNTVGKLAAASTTTPDEPLMATDPDNGDSFYVPRLEVIVVRLPCGCLAYPIVIRTNSPTDAISLPSHQVAPDLFCLPQRDKTNTVAGYQTPKHWIATHADNPHLHDIAEHMNAQDIALHSKVVRRGRRL